jgi:hypothetical protein
MSKIWTSAKIQTSLKEQGQLKANRIFSNMPLTSLKIKDQKRKMALS